MALSIAQKEILSHTIVYGGRSAVGKQAVAEAVAGLRGGRALVTGRLPRALGAIAERWQQIDATDGELPRLRPGAEGILTGLLIPGTVSVRFVSVPGDRALHIFYSRDDMTEEIHPQFRRKHGLSNLEPAAAVVATNHAIRPHLTKVWRQTILKPENNVTGVVAKRPHELVPESPLVVWLEADREVSAQFRMLTGANVRDTVTDEIAYLQSRDGNHSRHGLDDMPSGAFRVDMNPYLLEPGGPERVAELVFAEYQKRLKW